MFSLMMRDPRWVYPQSVGVVRADLGSISPDPGL